MALDVADHPAAAVKEHQHRQGAGRGGTVEPRRDRASRSGDRQIAGLGDRHRLGRQHLAPGVEQQARLGCADRLERRTVCRPDHLEQDLGIRIERHQLVAPKVRHAVRMITPGQFALHPDMRRDAQIDRIVKRAPLIVKNLLSPPAYSCHRREPHSGQKAQSSTATALSVGRDQKRCRPESSEKSVRLTHTEIPNAEADCFRHSRQWQT
jgi:hypothetical protein